MEKDFKGNFADVLSDDFIRETVGKLVYDIFMTELKSLDLHEVIDAIVYEDPPNDETEKVYIKYIAIRSDIERLTELMVNLDYHSADDNGGTCDEVDEWFWSAHNVYQLTEVGIKNASHFSRKFYTY